MYNSKLRNIEIPENLFSNLGEIKKVPLEPQEPIAPQESVKIIDNYQKENDIKLTNFSKHNEYRERITKMYEDIKDLKPIDNEINDTIYFNNYTERGIVVKPKVSSLKQFWTEYRLIKNEKEPNQQQKIDENLENFDKLFEELSIRVSEINKYIDELKEMKVTINNTTVKLKEDKDQLKTAKKEFQDYKTKEETKLKEDKETLKINFERLQTIINDLDKKLGSIDN